MPLRSLSSKGRVMSVKFGCPCNARILVLNLGLTTDTFAAHSNRD